jgi:hypothetical protein
VNSPVTVISGLKAFYASLHLILQGPPPPRPRPHTQTLVIFPPSPARHGSGRRERLACQKAKGSWDGGTTLTVQASTAGHVLPPGAPQAPSLTTAPLTAPCPSQFGRNLGHSLAPASLLPQKDKKLPSLSPHGAHPAKLPLRHSLSAAIYTPNSSVWKSRWILHLHNQRAHGSAFFHPREQSCPS